MTQMDTPRTASIAFGILRTGDHLFGVSTNDLAEVVPITNLTPYPSRQPDIIGAISVRGVMIPVLNPLSLCGFSADGYAPKVAALLRNERNMVALAMDYVVELRRIAEDTIQTVENVAKDNLITGFFLAEDKQINVISADVLFAQPDLPLASRRLKIKQTQALRDVLPHLTFESGGVHYAIAVSSLYNTIPRRALENTDVASGPFVGKITYHGRAIPIVDMNALMGMGTPRETELSEIVVIHVGEDRLMGLAVDRILRIEYFKVAEITPIPDCLQSAMPLVTATHHHEKMTAHILIVASDRIAQMPEMEGITGLSDETTDETAAVETRKSERQNVLRERNRNLVFSAGCEFAVPVQEVCDVLYPPKQITPWQAEIRGLKGLFFFRNKMTPLIYLTEYLGHQPGSSDSEKHVLVCGADGIAVGFLVDGVQGILQSDWQTESKLETGFEMVHIIDRGNSRLSPRLALEALASEVMESLSAPDPVPDLVPDPAPDSVPDPAPDAVPDTGSDTIPVASPV